MELVGFGLTGTNFTAVLCEIETDPSNSTFDIIFDYFGESFLYYDPRYISFVMLALAQPFYFLPQQHYHCLLDKVKDTVMVKAAYYKRLPYTE